MFGWMGGCLAGWVDSHSEMVCKALPASGSLEEVVHSTLQSQSVGRC